MKRLLIFLSLGAPLLFGGCVITPEVCHLSDAMRGVVTDHGQPVQGARITQEVTGVDDRIRRQETTTNSQGEFYLRSRVCVPIVVWIHQPMASTKLTLEYRGRRYRLFSESKTTYDAFGGASSYPSDSDKPTKRDGYLFLKTELTHCPPATNPPSTR